ncbi:oxidoreductase [Psychroserpens sp. SPM9]|uniref:WD40/YVTN/BNR-like repeat-containing protein n=1 Tax=Psychroserpens sp. SPM9 TaxID=2975598 RepID=UPI0021A8F7E2|nr:oxidoreductase [Psychroserpens sp. SPM9]MDG5492144.1 oxidoreductase [Psychroserpens sp. SPM9]
MKRILLFFLGPLLIVGLGSCGLWSYKSNTYTYKPVKTQFTKVEIETLVQDSTLNVRALEIVESIGPIYLTSLGELGMLLPQTFISHVDSLKDRPFYHHKINLSNDTLKLNFRALGALKTKGFGITIGSPALLYKLNADLEKNELVYREDHPDVFYDAMEFWNEQEGIAIGDSVEGCLSVIITRDGGDTWSKLACDQLPKGIEGEGAFAASDTNIAIVGNKTWVGTTAGRIYYSEDKGVTWTIRNTPIVKAKETEGIYSLDFYDELNGFAIGGDYTQPEANSANKIRTADGGKTWQLVAQNQSPGYRSCVQYVPHSNGKELVAIGFKGIDYSANFGDSWTHLSDEGFYTLRFLNDSTAYAAGQGRLAKLKFK